MNYIYLIDTSEIAWDTIKHKMNILSLFEQSVICELRQDKDKVQSLIGKLLLLYALKQNRQDEKWEILPPISYTNYKKPFVRYPQVGFNVSHAGEKVVCAFSEQIDIGVDIEKKADMSVDEFIHVLTLSEYEYLNKEISQSTLFYRLWTAKEAIMKADGRGFYLSPQSINLDLSNRDDIFKVGVEGRDWFVFSCIYSDDYVLSFASREEPILQLEEVTIDTLL